MESEGERKRGESGEGDVRESALGRKRVYISKWGKKVHVKGEHLSTLHVMGPTFNSKS